MKPTPSKGSKNIRAVVGITLCALIGAAADRPQIENSDARALKFTGISVYNALDPKAAAGDTQRFLPVDTNHFELIVAGCAWRMSLLVPNSDTPSHVADDGTNVFVLAQGSGGTTLISDTLTSYSDTAIVAPHGARYPKHHGLPVWLLFAGHCSMPSPAGQVGNILSLNPPRNVIYERTDDPRINSFGPSVLRLLVAVGESEIPLLVAEMQVLDWSEEGEDVLPSKAELRMVEQRPGDPDADLIAIYQLSGLAVERVAPPSSIAPLISRATEIRDLRPEINADYIASAWQSVTEASNLVAAGQVKPRMTPALRRAPAAIKVLLFLLVLTTPIILYRLAVRSRSRTH